jgi:rSAM/selenodomain-associated transferase 1
MRCRNECAIGVMAKAPQPGKSKTRLCPPLTPHQAAALSAAFLRDITENIALSARFFPISGYIAYAPAGGESLFDGHLAAGTSLILADGTPAMPAGVDGFGRSLLHAIQAMLALGHGSAVVLNSDSPTLPTSFLCRTAEALTQDGDRVVLGPAEDGGYYLLGMKQAHARLFADIAWSTDSVAETTRARAAELGLEVVELPTWYDVDDHAALTRLIAETADSARLSRGQGEAAGHDAPPRHGRAWPGHPRLAVPESANAHIPYPAPVTALALARMDLAQSILGLAAE